MTYTAHIKWVTAFLLVTTGLTCNQTSWAATENNQDAFGNNFKRTQVQLVVNQLPIGTVMADTTLAGYAKVKPQDLRPLLSGYLSADQDSFINNFNYEAVLLERMRNQGFPITFDPSSQTIKINLPKSTAPKSSGEIKAQPASLNIERNKSRKSTASLGGLKTNRLARRTVPPSSGAAKASPDALKSPAFEQFKKANEPKKLRTAQIGDKEEVFDVAVIKEEFFPLEVPLTVNRAYLGDISAEATLSGVAKVDVLRLVELLESRLSPEKSDILTAYGDTYVLLEELNAKGFLIVYDPAELSVKLTLAKEGVSVMNLSGKSIDNIDFDNFEKPASLSAGASFILRPRYIHESQFRDAGFAPLSAGLRGFFSAGGFNSWAFTYELDALEGRDNTFRRGDFTLIKDDFRKAIRLQAGDIRPSISGFQNGFNILGIGVERNYGAIQPFRNLRPGGRTQFTLERAARVNFEVNDVVTASEFLDPGDYDIQDFPLLTGSNDVRIVVDDEFGTREVGSYSTFVDSDLLSSGTTLYGANIGVIREGGGSGFSPNYGSALLGTAFYEKAIADNLTLGVQGEATSSGAYLGSKAVHSRGQSVFAVETGVSAYENFDPGYAVALQYRFRPTRNRTKASHDIVAQFLHQNDSFQTIGTGGNPRGKIWQFSANDSIRMKNFSINLSGSWRRDQSGDTTTFSPSISIPIHGVSLSLGYQGSYRTSQDGLDNRFFFTLSKNLGDLGTIRSRSRTAPFESELEWQRLSNREVGAISGRASYLTGKTEDELNLDATYIASRAEIDISHNSVLENGFGKTISSVTDARLGFGLGYADGALAFGRPVSDGFVIVKGHPSLKGKKIDAVQSSGRLEAVRDKFGPALVPLNSPYTEKVHRVVVQDLPAGLDIGSDEIRVFPSQNSGYKVRIGTDPTALVIGRLQDKDGAAVSLSVGQLISAENPEALPIEFFTNRTGRFVAERVPPGQYTMILMPNETVVGEVEIGAGEEGVVQLGTLTLKETQP